jgi:hypothetical protein
VAVNNSVSCRHSISERLLLDVVVYASEADDVPKPIIIVLVLGVIGWLGSRVGRNIKTYRILLPSHARLSHCTTRQAEKIETTSPIGRRPIAVFQSMLPTTAQFAILVSPVDSVTKGELEISVVKIAVKPYFAMQ